MVQVVRASKYRHVFGTAYKNEQCYSELRLNIPAWDCNCIKANGQFIAVPWAGGGGSLGIIPHALTGRKAAELPLINGHSGGILDFDFNPFNDNILASCSVDQSVKIWGIPEGGLKENIKDPLVSLDGHDKKVGLVLFHPVANNILASAGCEPNIKLWDIEHGKCHSTVTAGHKDTIQSLSFNRDGSQFVTTCKDKKLRIFDPRVNTVACETEGHQGTKGSRSCWMGKFDKIFTAGFTKLSERHYMIWDPKKLDKPIYNEQVDVSSGLLLPFFDEDTSIMYLAGKGDGNVRYYEMVNEEPYAHFLSEYKSNNPQRGMCSLPKVAVDVTQCEVTRLYKLTNTQVIPIMFQVPRKSEHFQADIFPDSLAAEPALTAEEFFGGQNAQPKTTSMKPGENSYFAKTGKVVTFQPKVEKKEPKVDLPPKTSDPKELLAQNEELRKRVEALEKENHALKQKIEELEKAATPSTPVPVETTTTTDAPSDATDAPSDATPSE